MPGLSSPPLVSVIIPAYNGEQFLGEALASVVAQDYPALEVIVINDGSTDATASIVRTFTGVRHVVQANQGNAVARNHGIALARGDVLALLDQDDLWLPHKISTQMRWLTENPTAEYVVCHARMRLAPDMSLPSTYNPAAWNEPFLAHLPSALLARRSAFARVGLFDPSFRFGSDSDWFFRASDLKVPTVVVPDVLMEKRIHAANQGHDRLGMRKEMFEVLRSSLNRKRGRAGS